MLCDAEFVSSPKLLFPSLFPPAAVCRPFYFVCFMTNPSLCFEILDFVFPFEHFIDLSVCVLLLLSFC